MEVRKELRDVRAEGVYHYEENRELLLKILQSQQEMQKLAQLHQAGRPEARDLMENGQKVNASSSLHMVAYPKFTSPLGVERNATGSLGPTNHK